jgi:uncharacterized damage-inducible protein DinB
MVLFFISMQDSISQFQRSTENVAELISGLSETLFVLKPAPTKWSIAEILEHLNISDRGSYLAIVKSDQPATTQDIEASEQRIAEMLRYNSNNWVAPDSATPKGTFKEVALSLHAFVQTRDKILDFVQQNDLSLFNANIAHPRLGHLTRQQWLQFVTWHANHHRVQMENIIQIPK